MIERWAWLAYLPYCVKRLCGRYAMAPVSTAAGNSVHRSIGAWRCPLKVDAVRWK